MIQKIVIVNINIEIRCPKHIHTDEQAERYAMNHELPSGYVENSYEFVKVIDEETKNNETIYQITTNDVDEVAKDMGISIKNLTPNIRNRIQHYVENGMDWYDTVKIAIGCAFDELKENK